MPILTKETITNSLYNNQRNKNLLGYDDLRKIACMLFDQL